MVKKPLKKMSSSHEPDEQTPPVQYRAHWNGSNICLSKDEYNIAMAHVESVRRLSEDNNRYGAFEEEDADYIDPETWKLSDTLYAAIEEAHKDMPEGSDSEKLIYGLCKLASGNMLSDVCEDDDADDVFSKTP